MSPNLEKVKIYNCDSVEDEDVFGFGGRQGIPVANIRRLIVRCCGSLRNLFPPSIVRGLMHLQELTIDGCSMMEEVIWEGRGEDGHVTNKIEFPRLENISLTELEVLTGFSRGIDKIEFPELKKLRIKYLPKVKSFFPRVVFPHLEELKLVDLPNASDLWCSELSTGSFCKLRSLVVRDCHGLVRNALPAHILKVPPNLEKVEIYNCDSVEEVFRLGGQQGNPLENIRTLIVRCCGSLRNINGSSGGNEDEEQMGGDRIYVTLFAQLKHLELRDLPSLGKFCHAIHDWEMPSLHHLEAVNCPEMQTLSPGFVHAPNLYHVKVEAKSIRIKRDLNKTIQHFFEKICSKVLKNGCGRRNGGGDAVAVAGCKGRSVTVAQEEEEEHHDEEEEEEEQGQVEEESKQEEENKNEDNKEEEQQGKKRKKEKMNGKKIRVEGNKEEKQRVHFN
ncbi:unnamed protein product [Camellia sinensis]